MFNFIAEATPEKILFYINMSKIFSTSTIVFLAIGLVYMKITDK